MKKHCNCGKEIDQLPGAFTFLYKSEFKLECNNDNGVIGVRIPDHEFTELVQKTRVNFVTTSVNKSGEEPIFSLAQLPKEVLEKVDVIVDVGPIKGKPSTIIDYTQEPPKIIRS